MNNLMPTLLNVSNKGQILIPSAMRKFFDIQTRGKVVIYPLVGEKKLVIEPIAGNVIEAACGLLAGTKKESWSEELLKERRKDLVKEEVL